MTQVRQSQALAGEVGHGGEAAGAQRGHGGGHVAGEVDRVAGTEVAEVGIVLTRPRGDAGGPASAPSAGARLMI